MYSFACSCFNFQVIEEDVLLDLEKMEKASDIDDILCYRSVAEHELHVYIML